MFKQICLSDLNEQNKDTQFSRKRSVHRLELGIVAVAIYGNISYLQGGNVNDY